MTTINLLPTVFFDCHNIIRPVKYEEYVNFNFRCLMDMSKILTEEEYTRERSPKELFEWVKQKEKEVEPWCHKHSKNENLRAIKYRKNGLLDLFSNECRILAYYAIKKYDNRADVKVKPLCDFEPKDGIIIDNGNEIFVEITHAINEEKKPLQKRLLISNGHSPWEYNILGDKGNGRKQSRSPDDIITDNRPIKSNEIIENVKGLIRKAANKKCEKSMKPKLPYGQKKTVLIVAFDDTGIGPHFDEHKRWDAIVDFKKNEIDRMPHNFRKIQLFAKLNEKFIE